jgi:transposase, IS5 family
VQRRKEIEEKKKEEKEERKKEEEGEREAGGAKPDSHPPNQVTAAAPDATATTAPASATAVQKTRPRGDKAQTTRSRDGTWTKKRGRSYFGYKLHTKDDLASGFIDEMDVTTASVHDNNVDLTKKGEVCVRDRAYTGGKGLCVNMIRATKGSPLTKEDKELNKFLSTVRAPVEHPYAVMKRVFHAGRVRVTTLVRVNVRMTFVCTCYNLFRALTLTSRTAKKL